MSRGTRIAIALALGAALVRVVAFVQLERTPMIRMDRWAQTDMHYFDRWARQIAAGDWRTATVPLPMHRWHHEIAERYLQSHPEAAAALRGRADADALLWARWMRAPRFYQDPLYSYVVALIYRSSGADPRGALAAQLAAGVLTVLLVWAIARRYFGEAVGATAGVLALLCAPLLFYELLLLRDSLVVFSGLALVWLADRALTRPTSVRFATLGIGIGAACLLKSTFVLLAVAFPILLLVVYRRRPPRWSPALACIAGLAVGVAPLVARNVAAGAPPWSLAASGPMTFVAANEPQAVPEMGFGIDAPVLTSFLGDTDGGWAAAWQIAMAGQTPAHLAALLWRKWDRVWHWFEIPNNENLYYLRTQVPMLVWLPITFWCIGPLALVGLAIGWPRLRDAWPLYLLVGTIVASMLAFYVLGRFRAALIAAAIPFAALTIVQTVAWIHRKQRAAAALTAAAVLLLGAWMGRPIANGQVLIRTADWILPYSVFYQDEVYGALDRHDWNTAASRYLEFFAYEPADAAIMESEDRTLAPELADMHQECAQILRMAGRAAEADQQLLVARRILALRAVH